MSKFYISKSHKDDFRGYVRSIAQQTSAPSRRRSGGYYQRHSFTVHTSYWVINSKANGLPALFISFTRSSRWDVAEYEEVYIYDGNSSVHLLIADVTLTLINTPPEACQKAMAYVSTYMTSEGIWDASNLTARSLANQVGILDVFGLTEGLIMAYIIDLVQPELSHNDETPLEEQVRSKKARGIIPISFQDRL
ncbi:Protein component of the small (40S) ribosomal subunit [Mucor velutinosus]|uniref:Protein component of the small (40S) ribosomal subunit n=1 Tax=Mucor velutinosus TaxID=708070 RepID=A0AAN7HWD6_9FUNG|nr:Protein component of the small (40S) ribosomal subunit [Mucor velutinosus]